jgi:hypothetical protein
MTTHALQKHSMLFYIFHWPWCSFTVNTNLLLQNTISFMLCSVKNYFSLYFIKYSPYQKRSFKWELYTLIRSIFNIFITIINLAQFRYLGMTITNQNLIQEDIKRRLNFGNACYHSVQKLCLLVCCLKT